MRTIIASEVYQTVSLGAHEELTGALWRFNHLVKLEDFPPFKRMELDLSGMLPIDPPITDTDTGIRFTEKLVDEFWRVNDVFASSEDEDVLIGLFSDAFISIFRDFDSEIHIANEYASHFQGVERSLIAAEVFADPDLESIWGSPLPDGVYRCEPCLLDYPEFQYGIHAIYHCDDCKEILDFNSHPVIGEDL
jgi:hypothetical protein